MSSEVPAICINHKLPAANNGKYRFKVRGAKLQFGKSFSARTMPFHEGVYLEWQIGYDATEADVRDGKKTTTLTDHSFVGANGKKKHLYELSELLVQATKLKLVSRNQLEELRDSANSVVEFLDSRQIQVSEPVDTRIDEFAFRETHIALPTFYMLETPDETQIEVSIQKQQYAAGTQPMVYFCIPVSTFKNWEDLNGRQSQLGDEFIYRIDKTNAANLLSLMKIFSLCSKSHQHDVLEILRVALELCEDCD